MNNIYQLQKYEIHTIRSQTHRNDNLRMGHFKTTTLIYYSL